MTFWSKHTNHAHRKFFIDKESFNSFFIKLEVLTDSSLIVNSVRILIVACALLLAYIHTSNKHNDGVDIKKNELLDSNLESSNEDFDENIRLKK